MSCSVDLPSRPSPTAPSSFALAPRLGSRAFRRRSRHPASFGELAIALPASCREIGMCHDHEVGEVTGEISEEARDLRSPDRAHPLWLGDQDVAALFDGVVPASTARRTFFPELTSS